MKRIGRASIAVSLVAALAMLPGAALAAQPPAKTYLALGDSLAVGTGATPLEWQFGYVGRFSHWFRDSRDGPHEITNLAKGGETSGSFVSAGQLAAAVQAVDEPDTDVQVVTLDIGGNDLLGLLQPGGPCAADPGSPQCRMAVAAALGGFSRNYPAILGSLAGALARDPGAERVQVTTYYNPFDGTGSPYEAAVDGALFGADGRVDCAAARVTPANAGLNDLITCISREFAPYGVRVVDIYPLFDGNALALTHIAEGDIHPNNDGHAVIADALVAAAQ